MEIKGVLGALISGVPLETMFMVSYNSHNSYSSHNSYNSHGNIGGMFVHVVCI